MEIINLTPNVGTLQGNTYNLNAVKYSSPVTFTVLFKGVTHKDIVKGCGACTKAEVKSTDLGVEVTITYTPSRGGQKGTFSKSFTEYHSEGQTKIIFTGNAK